MSRLANYGENPQEKQKTTDKRGIFRSLQDKFLHKSDLPMPAEIHAQMRSAHKILMNQQVMLTSTLKSTFAMADQQDVLFLWVKNENARYVFANRLFRNTLLNGAKLEDIYNHTDAAIIEGKELNVETVQRLQKITPETLYMIDDYLESGTRICNLTDIITKIFCKPCKFVENIDDHTLVTWKEPLMQDGKFLGTVGYGVDMSHSKQELMEQVLSMAEEYRAWQIDSTESYYLADYDPPRFSVSGVL